MQLIEIDNNISLLQTIHSSKGNQLKWNLGETWVKADGLGYEGLAEVLASELLTNSTVKNHVRYELVRIRWQGRLYDGCASGNFREEGWQLVTLEKLYRKMTGLSLAATLARFAETEERIKYVVDFTQNVTGLDEFGRYLATMLEMDAFFLNEDRHTNNIAVMYQPETGKFDYCPYFDFGAGFYSDMMGDCPLEGGGRTPETGADADANSSDKRQGTGEAGAEKANAGTRTAGEQIEEFEKIIRAKPFCRDFDEQADAAIALYGSDYKFTVGKQDLMKIWTRIRTEYESESVKKDVQAVCERVETVLRMQIRKYGNLF